MIKTIKFLFKQRFIETYKESELLDITLPYVYYIHSSDNDVCIALWIEQRLSEQQDFIYFPRRIFWGADVWTIENNLAWEHWSYFRDLPLLSLSDEVKAVLELDLHTPKNRVAYVEEIKDILEYTEYLPLLSYKRFYKPPRFPLSDDDFIPEMVQPKYVQYVLLIAGHKKVYKYFQRRRIKKFRPLNKRGEINYSIRQYDIYPKTKKYFELNSDARENPNYKPNSPKPEQDPEFDDWYYSMVRLDQHFIYVKLALIDLYSLFFYFYNDHNRVVLRNEWKYTNFPFKELFRRALLLRWISESFLRPETYFFLYVCLYTVWQRYFKSVFSFFYNPFALTFRNMFFVILVFDWFRKAPLYGDGDWDGNSEVRYQVDYALEEHINPQDQNHTSNLGMYSDEIASREFTDLKQNEARYLLFEPEMFLQSDRFESFRRFEFIQSTTYKEFFYNDSWWQQWGSHTWWWWGFSKMELPEPLVSKPYSFLYLLRWRTYNSIKKFITEILFVITKVVSDLYIKERLRHADKSIRPGLVLPFYRDVTPENPIPLVNEIWPWKDSAYVYGLNPFRFNQKMPNTPYTSFWHFSQTKQVSSNLKLLPAYTAEIEWFREDFGGSSESFINY